MNKTIEKYIKRSYTPFFYLIKTFFRQIYGIMRHVCITKQTLDLIIFVISLFQCLLLPITSIKQILYFIFIAQVKLLVELLNYFIVAHKFVTSRIKQKLILHIMNIPITSVLLLTVVTNKLSNFFVKIVAFIMFIILAVCQSNLGPFRISESRQSLLSEISQMLNFAFLFLSAIYATCSINTMNTSSFFIAIISLFAIILLLTSMQMLPTYKTNQYKLFFLKVFIPLFGTLFTCIILINFL
ncbi:MAG: hypothetical protein LBD36_00280 [Holosporales bacterium]|nr:hypothetical protein [Holosporales bacterium]